MQILKIAFIFGKNGANQPKNEIELRFLEAAEYGNIPTVRRMLEGFFIFLLELEGCRGPENLPEKATFSLLYLMQFLKKII